MSESSLDADTFCFDSTDCFSDKTLDEDVGFWGRASVWAVVDIPGETPVDAEFCTWGEMTADVWGGVDTGGAVLVEAAVGAATGTGATVVVDT